MRYSWLLALVVLTGVVIGADASADSDDPGARIDSIVYRVEVQGDKARIHEFERITIVSKSGDDHGVVSVQESSLIKLLSVNITVDKGGGSKPVKAGKKDMIRFCGYGGHSAAYSEDCQYDYHPEVTSYPYTVTVESEYEAKTLYVVWGDWRGCFPPISSMVVEATGKTGDEFRWKTFGGGEIETLQSNSGTVIKRWTWTRDSISFPERKEVFTMPPEDRPVIGVKLVPTSFVLGGTTYSGVDSWNDVASVYANLARDRYDHMLPEPESILALSNDAKSNAIYNDVIERSRYFAVGIGISGWQTERASFTEKTLWADCKGLTTWLVSRARKNGLTAFPALALTRNVGMKDPSFPDFYFNHLITMITVGADTQWYDPTCDICPPGVLPIADQGILALVITDSGGVLVRTPIANSEQNWVNRIIDIDLSQDGFVKAIARIESFGNIAAKNRSSFRQSERAEWTELAKSYLAGDLEKRFVVDSVSVDGLDDITKSMLISFQLRSKRPVDRVGNTAFFQPFQFSGSDAFRDYKLEGRASRVDMGYHYSIFDSVIIHGALIEGADSVFIPPAVSFDSDALSVSMTSSREPGAMAITLHQVCRQFSVSATELLEFSKQRQSIFENRIKLWQTAK